MGGKELETERIKIEALLSAPKTIITFS
jgi:hypothetical protein